MGRQFDQETLRRSAEAQLKHRCAIAEADAADASRLLHELQVHQIELEMQNSELLEMRGQLETALMHYTELYDFAPVGYFSLDRRGIIRQLNLAGARLLDSNRAALTGQAFTGFIEPEYRTAFADALHRVGVDQAQHGCELVLARPVAPQPIVRVELAPSPGRGDESLRAVVVDVTAARLAQNALERHQETFKAIMTASLDLVYYVDREYAIQYINRVPDGLSMASVLGSDATAYVVPEHRAMVRHTLGEVFETGRTHRFEALARGSHDLPTWYETIAAPIYSGAEVAYVSLLSRDITERVEAARRDKALSLRLLGAQETVRRQLAGELHDRTSANLAALGINLEVAEMALKASDWPEVDARMCDSRALVQDTAASIRDICAELRPPALDYAGLVPAIEAYASQFSRRTGIELRLDCPDTVGKLPEPLESTLFRIVQEALTNIAKHARTRSAQVQLKRFGTRLHLAVSDAGCGFDPAASTEGQGVISMREMATFAGLGFELTSSPDNGTRIQIEFNEEA